MGSMKESVVFYDNDEKIGRNSLIFKNKVVYLRRYIFKL